MLAADLRNDCEEVHGHWANMRMDRIFLRPGSIRRGNLPGVPKGFVNDALDSWTQGFLGFTWAMVPA